MSSRRSSLFLMTLRLRWQRCWTSWRLKRVARRLLREQKRTELLGRSLDSSLLRQKELSQLQEQHRHRLQEMEGSRLFREMEPVLALKPPPEPVLPPEILQQVLPPESLQRVLPPGQQKVWGLPPQE